MMDKKTDSVLVQMLQAKPIVILPTTIAAAAATTLTTATKAAITCIDVTTISAKQVVDSEEEEDPHSWLLNTKPRQVVCLAKFSNSAGEDDSSGSSSSALSEDGECSCPTELDSGCDDDDEEEEELDELDADPVLMVQDKKVMLDSMIDKLCWQLQVENLGDNAKVSSACWPRIATRKRSFFQLKLSSSSSQFPAT